MVIEQKNLEYYEGLPYNIILECWDDGDGPYYVARVAELPHCLIHDDSQEGAIKEIQEVKREWIKSCLDRGIKVPEPVWHKHSGQISLRIPPSLHKIMADRAVIEGVSLNQYMTTALANAVGLEINVSKPKTSREPVRV